MPYFFLSVLFSIASWILYLDSSLLCWSDYLKRLLTPFIQPFHIIECCGTCPFNFFFPWLQWHCPSWLSCWSLRCIISSYWLLFTCLSVSTHPVLDPFNLLATFPSITWVHSPRFTSESLHSPPNHSLKQRFSSKVLRYNGYHGYIASNKLSVFVNDLCP